MMVGTEMKHLGDITKINGAEIEIVDVITGGSPCQDLSIAGKRAGLAGARSGLFMEQVRIVKEMRERDRANGRTGDMVRPRFMVWENVPGAFSSNKGKDFAAVLEEIIRIAEPEAPDIEVPEKGWPTWGGYHDEVGGRWSVAWRVHDAQHWGVPQRRRLISVVADFGGDTAGEILFERKSVSRHPSESGAAAEEAAGGFGTGADCAIPINDKATRYGGGGSSRNHDGSGNGLGIGKDGDPSPTIAAGDRHIGMAEEVSQTLNTMHDAQAVMCEDVSHALRAKAACAYREDEETYPVQNMVVRRLTPLECERLQGYPDGWTDIGEWMDSKGKHHKDADSPRYKALGNSIALPFWQWLIDRMAAYLPEGATMGSLFDGIGGFPLCWQRTHGDGTAKWVSEIEQFPIAVTKLRFGED